MRTGLQARILQVFLAAPAMPHFLAACAAWLGRSCHYCPMGPFGLERKGSEMKKRELQRRKIKRTKGNHGQKPTLHKRRARLKTGPKR